MGRDDDQKLLVRNTDRAYYALGVLGLESDYEKMDLYDGDD